MIYELLFFDEVPSGSARDGDLPLFRHLHHDHYRGELHRPRSRGSSRREEREERDPRLLRLHLHLHFCRRDGPQGLRNAHFLT